MEKEIIYCTRCHYKLRVPCNKGMLKVTCPKCQNKFIYDSGREAVYAQSEKNPSHAESHHNPYRGGQGNRTLIFTTRGKIKTWFILVVIAVLVILMFTFSVNDALDLSEDSQPYLLIGVCIFVTLSVVDLHNRANAFIEIFNDRVQGKAIEGVIFARSKDFSARYSDIRNVTESGINLIVLFTTYGDYKVPIRSAQDRKRVIYEIQKRIL